ncbi:MAG: response regulator [Gammaproteobacteria bacterium]|nr:MAG: response regulator [Gammaproteobacteria bacterium]
MTRIMIVDDEPFILKALTRLLHQRTDWEITTCETPETALQALASEHFDLILSDYRMPGMTGVELLKQARIRQPDAARLILSGQADMDAVLKAINDAEIYRFITKPWDDEDLVITLRKALEHQQVIIENARLAAEVKRQRQQIRDQLAELRRLESEAPGITRLNLDEEGYIVIRDEDVGDLDPS